MLRENQDVTAQTSLEVQVFYKDGQAPARLPCGFEVHKVTEGQNVLGHRSADCQRIGKGANISVHGSADLEIFREGDDVALHMSIYVGVISEEENVAFDSAVDPPALSEQKNVSLDGFVAAYADRFALAGLRCPRRH